MTTELNTLATALYVKIDDALKASPEMAPVRPKVGFAPTLSDAELVTLAVMSALLGFVSERRWLRYATACAGPTPEGVELIASKPTPKGRVTGHLRPFPPAGHPDPGLAN